MKLATGDECFDNTVLHSRILSSPYSTTVDGSNAIMVESEAVAS